jgi:hypothetical protein
MPDVFHETLRRRGPATLSTLENTAMTFAHPTRYLACRLAPLAACMALALGLSAAEPARCHTAPPAAPSLEADGDAHPAPQVTLEVTSCADDAGVGTLRHAVRIAKSGDVVDLGALACNTITLEAGAISIAVDDLVIRGPGRNRLTIDGHGIDRVFEKPTKGMLVIEDLTITHGRFEAAKAYGGCIYTQGSVTLARSAVNLCAAVGSEKAVGGAIVAMGDLAMETSELSGNAIAVTVGTAQNLVGAGGAVVVAGELQMHESTLSGNTALAASGAVYGGGALASTFTAERSTLAGNQAVSASDPANRSVAGGIASAATVHLLDTTIGGGVGSAGSGLLVGGSGFGPLVRSTIASEAARLASGADYQ